MNTREAFYVHVHGEQLGPYTIRHIDHLLQSGLISAETLYWTEELEQWRPVTELIPLREKPRRLRHAGIALLVLLPFLLLGWFFGPTLLDGWREQTQRDYTPEAAYWAARGVVRTFVRERGETPAFEPLEGVKVDLLPGHTATVQLEGSFLNGRRAGEKATWTVHLVFDPEDREWEAQSEEDRARPPEPAATPVPSANP